MVEFNINQIDGATCRHRQARGRKCILLARGVAMVTQALSLSTRVSRVKNRAQGCQCGPRASRDRPICKFPSSKDGSQKPEGRSQKAEGRIYRVDAALRADGRDARGAGSHAADVVVVVDAQVVHVLVEILEGLQRGVFRVLSGQVQLWNRLARTASAICYQPVSLSATKLNQRQGDIIGARMGPSRIANSALRAGGCRSCNAASHPSNPINVLIDGVGASLPKQSARRWGQGGREQSSQ